MKPKKLYYAVSTRGQGVVFTEKPERVEKIGVWSGKIDGCYCSVIADLEAEGLLRLPKMTYSDAPVELTLTVNYG